MAGRKTGLAVVVLAALALLAPSASARPPWAADLAAISKGLDRAVALGRLQADKAGGYREIAGRAAFALPRLRSSRYSNLAGVVHEVAALSRSYDEPRALTLFSMLDFNTRWFSKHWDRPAGTDRINTDGVLYRAFPGIGFQFHPLGEFGRLNFLVGAGRFAEADALAQALIDRAVLRAGGLAWEYYFRFGGGRPPWISGMAQAVAAQALSRAGTRMEMPDLVAAAGRAYATVPRLTLRVSTGPWIRLYAFSSEAVLNAQLQTIVSLQDYVSQTNDARAAELVNRLLAAADGLLPRFDTGSWSRYSLGGPEATLHYHRYVVNLLRILAARTKDPVLVRYRDRFNDDLTEPPVVTAGRSPEPIYPWPVDGFRDAAPIAFWIDKGSTVRLVVAGGQQPPVAVARGWHTLLWRPGAVEPGTYIPALHAVDVAGNASDTELEPVVVRRDTTPPRVSASVHRKRVYWNAVDRETPWITLRVVLRRGGDVRTLALGRRPLRGSARFTSPAGTWNGTLYAADSSGNTGSAPLGRLQGG